MNKNNKLVPLALLSSMIFAMIFVSSVNSVLAQHHDMGVMNHCETPTNTFIVGTDSGLKFNVTEIKIAKNTCATISFMNQQTQEHDFTVNETHNEFEMVHMHLDNNTDGHMRNGMKSMNILTPDKDVTYQFYCSIEGHKEAGMEGTIVVGSGGSTTAFGFEAIVFVGLFTILGLITVNKRKYRN